MLKSLALALRNSSFGKVIFAWFASVSVIICTLYVRSRRECLTATEFRKKSAALITAQNYKLIQQVFQRGSKRFRLATAYRDLPAGAIGSEKGSRQSLAKEDCVVIVHGGTFGSVAYHRYVEKFIPSFRVVTYDQYGRGFSDRVPQGLDNDLALSVEQLKQLLDEIVFQGGMTKKVLLYGVSLGGAVAGNFAASYPNHVSGLCLQAPVISPDAVGFGAIARVALWPLIGEFLMRTVIVKLILRRGEAEVKIKKGSEDSLDVDRHFSEQFLVHGSERSFLSMLRSDLFSQSRVHDHEVIGSTTTIPVLFQYASDDPEIPARDVLIAHSKYSPKSSDLSEYIGGHFFTAAPEALESVCAEVLLFAKHRAVW